MTKKLKFINDIMSLEKDEFYIAARCFTSLGKSSGEISVRFEFNEEYSMLMGVNRDELIELCKQCLPYAGYFDSLKENEDIGFMEFHFYLTEEGNEDNEGVAIHINAGIYLEIQNHEFYQTSLPGMASDFLEEATGEINLMYQSTLIENQSLNSSGLLN